MSWLRLVKFQDAWAGGILDFGFWLLALFGFWRFCLSSIPVFYHFSVKNNWPRPTCGHEPERVRDESEESSDTRRVGVKVRQLRHVRQRFTSPKACRPIGDGKSV